MDRHLEKTQALLNDLIEVNGQRIISYQSMLGHSVKHTNAEQELFEEIIVQGQELQNELEVEFVSLTRDLPKRGDPNGLILQVWGGVSSFLVNKRSVAIGELFDKGERALIKAYQYAEKQLNMPKRTKTLITRQKKELSAFYKRYKQLYTNHKYQPA